MISRRELLSYASAAGALALLEKHVLGQVGDQKFELPKGIGVLPDFGGDVPPPPTLGTNVPLPIEVQTAMAIIDRAPTKGHPIDVARYFLDVGDGKPDRKWIPYVEGWPDRWNPVIVEFFHSTNFGQPKGDLTPWCAAFVNWCVKRISGSPATGNASSGSFKSYGKKTMNPKPGDIAVFRLTNDPTGASGRGHVGFFLSVSAGEIQVLGGNQINSGHHKINIKLLKETGPVLTLHSYRTSDVL
jgi:uncharacterized protein (TIGR02594 family)